MESIYLLIGQSAFLINEQIKVYQEQFKINEFNLIKIDALDSDIDVINQELQTVSFFSELKMVIIENVDSLNRFDENQLTIFLKYLEKPSDDIVLILSAITLPKNHVIETYLSKYAFIETIDQLEGKALEQYILNKFTEEGYYIEHDAIVTLLERTQNDLFLLNQEAQKIKTYALEDKSIKKEDVELLVTRNLEDNIFAFSTAYLKGNIRICIQIYEDLLTTKMQPSMIFSHLYNTINLILQTKKLIDEGLNQTTIASSLGVSTGRAYHLIKEAKQQRKADLEHLIKSLAQLDVDIKSGNKDDKLGIELLLLRRLP
ncbi:DNA polymerase III subunit delta [Acholeplasma granularum]|uniref:DNA polymerase III subunit delta n=1 Tax=Acholeplasma granularum TaxID=264635 RepID=UPI0004BA524D|nr:DNA polymerase III subunit delta [Acholeplasma granularum]